MRLLPTRDCFSRPAAPAPAAPRFPVLRQPAYRRFWVAGFLQDLASWLLFAAQGWLLLNLTHQPQAVALFFVLRMAPRIVLGLPAGAITDRCGALPSLCASRFAAALPALVLTAAQLTGQLTVPVLMLSALLTAFPQAFEQPAQRSLIYTYAPGHLLVGGIALMATAATLSTLVGPLTLALLVAGVGLAWVFPIQALLLVLSASLLLTLRHDTPSPARRGVAPSRAQDAVGHDCWAAVRYLAATPALVVLMLLAGSPGLLDRLLAIVTPGYATGQGGGAAGMMLLFLAPAMGALLGGSLLGARADDVPLMPLAVISSGVAVLSLGLLALTELFVLAIVLFALLGAAKATFGVAISAALQQRVPEHARGRLLAL